MQFSPPLELEIGKCIDLGRQGVLHVLIVLVVLVVLSPSTAMSTPDPSSPSGNVSSTSNVQSNRLHFETEIVKNGPK